MAQAIDISAVPLPPPWRSGLQLLVKSYLVDLADVAAASLLLVESLFGKDAPTFGQLARVSEDDLKAACGLAALGDWALPVAHYRELAELVRAVRPETPMCEECGRFPLSNAGGKIVTLPAGSHCPFCSDGTIAVLRMRLRKLAWTDGRLVEPQTTHDLRSRKSFSAPLDDDLIVAQLGGCMHRDLERSLQEANLPVYGFLAYMNLARRAFPSYNDGFHALIAPHAYGLDTPASIADAIREAVRFLDEREPTTVPKRTRLPFIASEVIDSLQRMTVDGRTYVIEGRIGRGDKCNVYRGAADCRNTERVIIKVCGNRVAHAKMLSREIANLTALAKSDAPGTDFISRLFPSVVSSGWLPGDDGKPRAVTVFRYKHQFDWTLADVLREYPEGVEPQTMVWMWNRCLFMLRWLQMAGFVHGALVPEHVLIHPGYHAATFIDWAHAVQPAGVRKPPVEPLDVRHSPFFPKEVADGSPLTFDTDVAMTARCMIAVLGGDPANGTMPSSVPETIADFLRVHARYEDGLFTGTRFTDGETLEKEFGKVTSAVYGKRRFHPFCMPRPSL